jgi:hypothetical protein
MHLEKVSRVQGNLNVLTLYLDREPDPQNLFWSSVPFWGQRLIEIFEKVYTPIVGKYMIAFLKW